MLDWKTCALGKAHAAEGKEKGNEFQLCCPVPMSPFIGITDKITILEYARTFQGPLQFEDSNQSVTLPECTPDSLGTGLPQGLYAQEG